MLSEPMASSHSARFGKVSAELGFPFKVRSKEGWISLFLAGGKYAIALLRSRFSNTMTFYKWSAGLCFCFAEEKSGLWEIEWFTKNHAIS